MSRHQEARVTSAADLFDLGETRFLDLGPGTFGTVSTVPDVHGRFAYTVRGSGWFECGTGSSVEDAEREAKKAVSARG